jgi:bacterioferritin
MHRVFVLPPRPDGDEATRGLTAAAMHLLSINGAPKRRIHQHFKGTPMSKHPHLTDVQTLRKRARDHVTDGAVTKGYDADRATVVKLLNDAIATEIVCVLRYRRHYFMAKGIHSKGIADEFLVHSNEEQAHADLLCERVVQLGGDPDLSPSTLTKRSHAEYDEVTSLAEMIREDLVAERIAIESYRELIAYLQDRDPTTRRMLEGILAVEEAHATEWADLLDHLPVQTGKMAAHPASA